MTEAVASSMTSGTADRSEEQASRPLVVRVEHGLVRCDLTLEALTRYLKRGPIELLDVVAWGFQGIAVLKRRLAERVSLDVATLPVDEALAAAMAAAAREGRPVYLASSGDHLLVDQLAARFPYLAGVIAGDGTTQLKGEAMAEALAQRFPEGFDYAGNAVDDVPTWRRAGGAVLVGASPDVAARAAAVAPIVARYPQPSRWTGLVRSLRLHQWTKNVLVFAPLILGGEFGNFSALASVALAFVALCLVASATYLVNDILDAADDRHHWSKKDRPIASGLLSPRRAAIAAAGMLAVGLAIGAALSVTTALVLVAYVVLTLAYSLSAKRVPLLDGFVLAVLFTLRLALGVAAAGVTPSPWLFVFSMFLFASLSYAKRYTELVRSSVPTGTTIAGRGYRPEDSPLVLGFGLAGGIGSVVIMVLYIIEDAFLQSFYGRTELLWGFPPLIFLLICRIWLVTFRGEMHDDPIKFVTRDRTSLVLLVLFLACFYFAWMG